MVLCTCNHNDVLKYMRCLICFLIFFIASAVLVLSIYLSNSAFTTQYVRFAVASFYVTWIGVLLVPCFTALNAYSRIKYDFIWTSVISALWIANGGVGATLLNIRLFRENAGRHTPESCLIAMECYVALSFINFILLMAFGVIRWVEQRPPLPNGIVRRPAVPPVPLIIQVGGGGGGGRV